MKRRYLRPHEVEAILRRGDPAGDCRGLTPDAAAMMRRRIVAEQVPVFEQAQRLRSPSRPFPAFAMAASLFSVLVIGWLFLRPDPPSVEHETAPRVASEVAETERPTRQLQFSTPGGTRIVWLFQADFEVSIRNHDRRLNDGRL